MDAVAEDILTFWFGTTALAGDVAKREEWFRATADFDRALSERFLAVHGRAAAGAFDSFVRAPETCLALIIALDQFPRNLFRGTERAFATDPKAREVAGHAVERGYDRRFSRSPRAFVYLPFEHSETLADQERALELYAGLGDAESMKYAVEHHDVIRRFGRFPHRNAVLGRQNTREEEEYLKSPPSWGKTAAEAETMQREKASRHSGEKT